MSDSSGELGDELVGTPMGDAGLGAASGHLPRDAVANAKPGDLIPASRSADAILEDGDDTGIPEQEEFFRSPARFGAIPVDKEPLGWDRRQKFNKLYPFVSLPTQVVERVSFGHPELEPNRLFWGDNLHVMRQLPSESIDLIYIDPPFFSGRTYNVIFGDQNEVRSFGDIWESGMPGYLEWLNARVFEMKRVLSPAGSLVVHLDWHAAHYAKIELDKIFGHEFFRNEVVWSYKRWTASRRSLPKLHDVLLWYSRGVSPFFVPPKVPNDNPNPSQYVSAKDENGRTVVAVDELGRPLKRDVAAEIAIGDVWDIPLMSPVSKERLGYPTQKPERLIERVVKMLSPEQGVVADFFIGGGTTASVAQRLGRRWIACDQSRVAVAVTADRLAKQAEQANMQDITGGGRPRFHRRTLGHLRSGAALSGSARSVSPIHRRCSAAPARASRGEPHSCLQRPAANLDRSAGSKPPRLASGSG